MPEQLKDSRNAKPPCDIHSAGACLYSLLSGKLPHDVTIASVAYSSILNLAPAPLRSSPPDLPPDLCAAVDRALSREPLDRFSSAQHMRQALLKFTEETGRRDAGHSSHFRREPRAVIRCGRQKPIVGNSSPSTLPPNHACSG